MMSFKTKCALLVSISLWASAFVGIRAGLTSYSPEGLALLRYLIASVFMAIVYFRLPARNRMRIKDVIGLMAIGVIGIGIYNLTLNYGEKAISSGMASFITSQSPIITAIIAILFLGEKFSWQRMFGFLVSVLGITLIAYGEIGDFKLTTDITYILLATVSGSCYSILQKPFLKKYHVVEATTYVIWGGTLFLAFYSPHLRWDIAHAPITTTLTIAYLGIFPAAVGYLCWSYVLSQIPLSRAVSFLYFMPFVATFMGWYLLGEVPVWISIAGGSIAIAGVWLVNQSYRQPLITNE